MHCTAVIICNFASVRLQTITIGLLTKVTLNLTAKMKCVIMSVIYYGPSFTIDFA